MNQASGFIDIEKFDPRIRLDIRYATANNFVSRAVYSMAKCFLREKVAKKLKSVQDVLAVQGLGLKVYDGYRPLSVQKLFWEILPDERYVGNPKYGSKHNRGAAVDLTLVDLHGKELLMPTDFDDFSEKAHLNCRDLPEEAIRNRDLLQKVMSENGFLGTDTEWWHFDDVEWTNYPIEDLSLEELCK